MGSNLKYLVNKLKLLHDVNKRMFYFELTASDKAFIEYKTISNSSNTTDHVLDIVETFVPEQYRGHKIAEKLTMQVFDYAKTNNKKLKLTCTYAQRFHKLHPEYNDICDLESN